MSEKSGGKMELQVIFNGQQGAEAAVNDKVKNGQLDMALVTAVGLGRSHKPILAPRTGEDVEVETALQQRRPVPPRSALLPRHLRSASRGLIVVLNEHGGSGGTDAAPTGMAILHKYFDLKKEDATSPAPRVNQPYTPPMSVIPVGGEKLTLD